ncbi:MAG: alpha/beta fold hydrolase [Calditrichae bacterium]|nr:alpha/beta fold hydrolase [Calditrichia bacterium]
MHYLYLHGFTSGASSYKGGYFRERFAEKGQTLHTPDLNGGDFEHLTLSSQLAIVEALADSLDGDLTLLGSSMGAYVAALFAEHHPRVRQLVLIAPAFQFTTRYLKQMDPAVLENWRKSGFIKIFHHAYGENRRLHYGIVEDAARHDANPLARQLPALLIHGLHDEPVPYRYSIDYLADHPGARLLLLSSDHQMADQVEVIWQYVAHFLGL